MNFGDFGGIFLGDHVEHRGIGCEGDEFSEGGDLFALIGFRDDFCGVILGGNGSEEEGEQDGESDELHFVLGDLSYREQIEEGNIK